MGHDEMGVDEAAERLGITPHSVRYLIRAGVLPARRLGRRVYLLKRDDVEARRIIQSRTERPGPERGRPKAQLAAA